jgi:hypothetical protein
VRQNRVRVGDLCSIWDPDVGPATDPKSHVLGIVINERKTSRSPQYQVHWSNTGFDETWYSSDDIAF